MAILWILNCPATDACSHLILCCDGHEGTSHYSGRQSFQLTFKYYDLPEAVRGDNGKSFGGIGAATLTKLLVWWLKLGITTQRTPLGKPP